MIVDHGGWGCLDLSAFLVVVWRTYRVRASGLIIVADATVYFLVMVSSQVYIQLTYNLLEVRSFVRFPCRFAKYDYPQGPFNKRRSCECAVNFKMITVQS